MFCGAEGDGLLGLELYANRDWWPDAAEGQVWMGELIECGWRFAGLHGDGKSLHAKAAGAVRIFKYWAADAVFTCDGF